MEIPAGRQDHVLCHHDLCCHFNVSTSCADDQDCDKYRLLAYSGTRFVGFGHYEIGLQMCGMVTCRSSDINSCAQPYAKPATTIDYLQIRGNISALTVLPSVLNKDLLLLPNGYLNFDIGDGVVSLAGTRPLNDVLSIGLYGRDYEKDDL